MEENNSKIFTYFAAGVFGGTILGFFTGLAMLDYKYFWIGSIGGILIGSILGVKIISRGLA